MKILVTGGTGTLGKHVVPLLRDRGLDVAALNRSTCDLLTEVPVVDGDVVVHLAGGQKGDDRAGAGHASAAGRRSGCGRTDR